MAMGVTVLFRVSLLVATCAVWVIAQDDENIIPEWLFSSGEEEDEATRIITTRKPKEWVRGGTSCLNSDECGRGKCCLRRNRSPRRRCRRFQRINEPCTEEQMMGGYYYGHCPCNKNGVCTYTGDTMRCVPKKQEPQQETPPPQAPKPPPAIPPNQPPGHKQDSQESEEVTAKPGGQARPNGEITNNEIPDLPFETLTGPGENSNVISPFIFHGTGSRLPGASSKPTATATVAPSSNDIRVPASTTNNAGNFPQGPSVVPPVDATPHPGGTSSQGQLTNPALVAPPPHLPNTRQGNGPSTSTHETPFPSSLPSPTLPRNNISPELGGPRNSLLPPSIASGSSGLLSTTDQEQRHPSLPPSRGPTVNVALPTGAEQEPSRFALPQSPSTTESSGLPPHADDGPPPPPLPPPPV